MCVVEREATLGVRFTTAGVRSNLFGSDGDHHAGWIQGLSAEADRDDTDRAG
jgi:hypothetical protein